jgi:hypothetical protein
LSFDGRTSWTSELELLAYAVQRKKVGEQVPVVVLRDGRKLEFQLPMQE